MNPATSQPYLPVVGPFQGETAENSLHRRGILRNVSLAPGPERFIGIKNLGNQCSFISIIQGLLHHSRVAQFCRYHHIGPRSSRQGCDRLTQHMRFLQQGDGDVAFNCGYCQLYEMLVRYWTKNINDSSTREIEVNSRFQKWLTRFRWSQFATGDIELGQAGEQQDAGDVYRRIIGSLAADPDCESHAPSDMATKALFTIGTTEATVCHQCGFEDELKNQDDRLLSLSFPPRESADGQPHKLGHMINNTLQAQVQTMIKRCKDCTEKNCPTGVDAKDWEDREGEVHTQSLWISHFPELFAMALSRFTHGKTKGTYIKVTDTAAIPEFCSLHLASYAQPRPALIRYRLCAVVKHEGINPHSGHYISYVSKPGTDADAAASQWWRCDDSKCQPASFAEAVQFNTERPYLLFWERIYPKDERDETYEAPAAELALPSWWKPKAVEGGQVSIHSDSIDDFISVPKSSNPPGDTTPKATTSSPGVPKNNVSYAVAVTQTTPKEATPELSNQGSQRVDAGTQTTPKGATPELDKQGNQQVDTGTQTTPTVNPPTTAVDTGTQTTPTGDTQSKAIQTESPSTKKSGKPRIRRPSDPDYKPDEDDPADDVMSDQEGDDDVEEEVKDLVDDEPASPKKTPPVVPKKTASKKDKDASYKPSKDGEDVDDDEDDNVDGKDRISGATVAPDTQQGTDTDPDLNKQISPAPNTTVTPPPPPGRTTRARPTGAAVNPTNPAPPKTRTKKTATKADSKAPVDYSKLTVVNLKKLMKKRKLDVDRKDKKADLVAKLEADDQKDQAVKPSDGDESGNASKPTTPERPSKKSPSKKRTASEVDEEEGVNKNADTEAGGSQDGHQAKKARIDAETETETGAAAEATTDNNAPTDDANTTVTSSGNQDGDGDGEGAIVISQTFTSAPLAGKRGRKRTAPVDAQYDEDSDGGAGHSNPQRKRKRSKQN